MKSPHFFKTIQVIIKASEMCKCLRQHLRQHLHRKQQHKYDDINKWFAWKWNLESLRWLLFTAASLHLPASVTSDLSSLGQLAVSEVLLCLINSICWGLGLMSSTCLCLPSDAYEGTGPPRSGGSQVMLPGSLLSKISEFAYSIKTFRKNWKWNTSKWYMLV